MELAVATFLLKILMPGFRVRDRPDRNSPRKSKKAGDFPARKPDEPSVTSVVRKIEFHLLNPGRTKEGFAARALIRQAGREAKVVIAYMHAGAEGPNADHVTGHEEYYLGEDRGNAEAFAHMAINAGASVVIASGPHVLRGMQFYKGHLIAYSLGNFASYGDFSTDGDLDMSVVLRVTLSSAGRFEHARIYPIQFTGEGRPVPGGGAVAFVAKLASEDFGLSAARILPSGVIKAP